MSNFNMKTWIPQEHDLRKAVIAAAEQVNTWLDPEYKNEVEIFVALAKEDRRIRKALRGTNGSCKENLKTEQNRNFDMLRNAYEPLKARLESLAESADGEFDNFEKFEIALTTWLTHWTPRIHTTKPQVGKNLNPEPKGPSKSSVHRFAKERDEKRKQQRIHVDNAPKDPFSAFADDFGFAAA